MTDLIKRHPSKAQFDDVKADLERTYGAQYFLINDHLISAQTTQSGMKLVIAVYVNGWIRSEWLWSGKQSELAQMPEISQRFYALRVSSLYSAKEIKSWEKVYRSKARAKAAGVYQKWCATRSYFSTAGAFIAHIKKHNSDIRILDYADYKVRLDQRTAVDSEVSSHGN